jgi:hypothetical protein
MPARHLKASSARPEPKLSSRKPTCGTTRTSVVSSTGRSNASGASCSTETLDQIAEKLNALRRVGVRYVILNIAGMPRDTLRTFAREIMPAFDND